MRTQLVGIGTVLALTVAACGGSDGDTGSASDVGSEPAAAEDEATQSAGDSSTLTGELENGTVLTVRLDVAETDPVVAPFAAFREQAGAADAVVWIVGSLDVPADFDDATGPATGRYLTFVPPGGEVISDTNPISTFACSKLDEWFGAPTGDDGAALNEAYIGIVNGPCNGQTLGVPADAGATTDYAMVIEGSAIPDFESVLAGLLTELEPVS